MNACPPPTVQRARFSPALVLAGFMLLAAAAQAVVHGILPLPRCLLLQFTGVPCPTCGCTRSLAAWTHFDVASAFQFNPLFFLGCVGLIGWALVRLLRTATLTSDHETTPLPIHRNVVWAIGATAVVLNWLYLYFTLPR